MGGRLYDWLGAGDTPDRPDAALDMPGLLGSPGSTAFFFDTTLKILSIYDESAGGSWFEIDAAALAAIAFATLPDVDFSTPPTDGQVFAWDTGDSKLHPVSLVNQTAEEIQDIVGTMGVNGTGTTFVYDDGAGTFKFDCTITQYTDELAQDALAAAFAAGSHTGITITYDDVANKFDFASTITQYTDELAQDALAAAFAAGSHTGLTITYNDGANKFDFAVTVTQYTDEMAQDTIAAIIAAGTHDGIGITYDDAGATLSFKHIGATIHATQNASFTPDLTMANHYIPISAAGAVTVTLPSNGTVAFPVGTVLQFDHQGAGTVAFAAEGGGSPSTVNSRGGALNSAGQYAVIQAKKIATSTWRLLGDLA